MASRPAPRRKRARRVSCLGGSAAISFTKGAHSLTCAKTVARRELVRPVSALVYCSCWPWSMRPYLQGDNRLGRLPKRTIAAVELCEVPRAIRNPRPSERDRLSTARQGKAQRRVIGPTIQRDDRDLARARVLEGDHFELASP